MGHGTWDMGHGMGPLGRRTEPLDIGRADRTYDRAIGHRAGPQDIGQAHRTQDRAMLDRTEDMPQDMGHPTGPRTCLRTKIAWARPWSMAHVLWPCPMYYGQNCCSSARTPQGLCEIVSAGQNMSENCVNVLPRTCTLIIKVALPKHDTRRGQGAEHDAQRTMELDPQTHSTTHDARWICS